MTAPFVLTRHRHLPGVRLSKPGHWGNYPLEDEAAAMAEVERHGGGKVRREDCPALRR